MNAWIPLTSVSYTDWHTNSTKYHVISPVKTNMHDWHNAASKLIQFVFLVTNCYIYPHDWFVAHSSPLHGITNKRKTQVMLLYYRMNFLSLKNFNSSHWSFVKARGSSLKGFIFPPHAESPSFPKLQTQFTYDSSISWFLPHLNLSLV